MQAGLVAVTRVAEYLGLEPGNDACGMNRADFDAALEALDGFGAPLVADRDVAWEWFEGRRAVYMPLLTVLAELVDAPPARAWTTTVERAKPSVHEAATTA
jgi:hypothetical protein